MAHRYLAPADLIGVIFPVQIQTVFGIGATVLGADLVGHTEIAGALFNAGFPHLTVSHHTTGDG